jgi:ornithine decarboxylase
MNAETSTFSSIGELLKKCDPAGPVYCIYPHVYLETAENFLKGFPGRVLYAVKANDNPRILRLLNQAGVRHFDCASLPEIEKVRAACPDATCYFMVPVYLRGAVEAAYQSHGVRHFMVDHASGVDSLAARISLEDCVVFARMAVSHDAAFVDLSSKFGAPPDDIPGLLERIRSRGGEPALAFNVGTMVTRPEAYSHSMAVARAVLESLDFRVRLVDIGGGFPRSYPDFSMPPLEDFHAAVARAARLLPIEDGGAILSEPGRALSAPGLSAVVEVLLRKEDRLYLNDGMYGIFWELRFKAHRRFPVRAYRKGERLEGATASFTLFGPTCDSSDELPGGVELPEDIRPGDHLEFGSIGAYSLSGRTDFNGHYSDRIVEISSAREFPP